MAWNGRNWMDMAAIVTFSGGFNDFFVWNLLELLDFYIVLFLDYQKWPEKGKG